MAKEYAKDFYSSAAWLNCRKSFLNSKMHICERCENRNGIGNIVHHKTYITEDNINDPDITLNWDNLECLCQTCHNKEHHREEEEATATGLAFDAFGQLKRVPPVNGENKAKSLTECPPSNNTQGVRARGGVV